MLSVTAVTISFEVPSNVNVSTSKFTVSVPLSPAISKSVLIVAVLTAVTKPLALTVTTGIAVVLPCVPVSLLTFANVVLSVTFAVPSNAVAVAVASPVTAKCLAVSNASAVSALPVQSPVTSPVTSPVKGPVN